MWQLNKKVDNEYIKTLHRKHGEIYDTINDIKYMLKQQDLKGYSLDKWVAERLK